MAGKLDLIVITPFRNEESTLEVFMDSVIRQTVQPVYWLMIDDNSTDGGERIVRDYARKHSHIVYLRYPKQEGERATGGNVVDIFNYGLSFIKKDNISWDIVAKLDADVVIDDKNYFEFILSKFSSHKSLGIASGVTYIRDSQGNKRYESKHRWHTQGQTKFYGRRCLEQMGGLKVMKGWDGVDDILARGKGFVTEKFFEYEIQHLYPTQTRMSEGGQKKGVRREALGYFNIGYPFYFAILKGCKIALDKGLSLGVFFVYSFLKYKYTMPSPLSPEERKCVAKFMQTRLMKATIPYT